MGLKQWLDSLLGRPRLVQPKADRLFALSTARPALEETLDWVSAGRAGLCLKPVVTGDYAAAQQEVAQLVRMGAAEARTRLEVLKDSYDYTWLVFEDPDFEDLLTLVHMAARTLDEQGYGTQILSAVFRFRPGERLATGGSAPERIYLIYNYKRGLFYPFVPRGAGKAPSDGRHESGELHASALLSKELPTEPDPSRWYPIWDCPV